MADPPVNAKRARRRSVVEAFYPLIAWAFGSLLILGWQWHERRLAGTILVFTAALDGALSFPEQVSAELDGQPFFPGQRMGLGRSVLVLTGQNLEPFRTNFFAWYGTNDLGELPLVRSKGTLEVLCDPPPKEVQVAGQFFETKRSDAGVTFAHIPVGDYEVTATFAHSWERDEVQVRRNATNRLDIAPAFGGLALVSDPKGAQFTLTCLSMANLTLTGTAPAEISELPAGAYNLSLQWNDSVKDTRVRINKGETNRQNVVFPYGTVRVATTPPGATVSSGFSALGKTPHTLLIKPGEYRFHLALDGYRSADISASVADKKTVVVSNRLVNVRYAEAMDAARNELDSRSGSYDRALKRVEEAVRIEPGDPDARALKAKIGAVLQEREAKTEETRKTAAAQAAEQARRAQEEAQEAAQQVRVREAQKKFEEATGREKDAALFPTRIWTFTNRFDALADAMRRMVARKDAPWKLLREEKPDDRTILFRCEGRGLVQSQEKRCVVMLTRMAPSQAYLCAKFWEYVLAHDLGSLLFAGSPDSYTPVAPGRYKPGEPGAAAAYLDAVAENFRKRLAEELK